MFQRKNENSLKNKNIDKRVLGTKAATPFGQHRKGYYQCAVELVVTKLLNYLNRHRNYTETLSYRTTTSTCALRKRIRVSLPWPCRRAP